jgi:hypothetical protein
MDSEQDFPVESMGRCGVWARTSAASGSGVRKRRSMSARIEV